MALTDKLTAIANAIRSKTGKTGVLTLEQMASEVSNISTGLDDSELALATATATDVLSGKTFYSGNKEIKTGTLVGGFTHYAAGWTFDSYSSNYTLPAGTYSFTVLCEQISYYGEQNVGGQLQINNATHKTIASYIHQQNLDGNCQIQYRGGTVNFTLTETSQVRIRLYCLNNSGVFWGGSAMGAVVRIS